MGPDPKTRTSLVAAAGNADDIRKYAAELAALAPDVILAGGGAAVPEGTHARSIKKSRPK